MEEKYSNLVAMQQASCQRFAERPLYGVKQQQTHEWISYAEFAEKIDHCRAGLASLGIGSGDAVAFISNNCVEWAVTAYATFGLEGIFIPMYLAQHVDDWRYIINDCQAKIIIVNNDLTFEKIQSIKDTCPQIKQIVVVDSTTEHMSFHDLCHQDVPAIAAKTQQHHETCCIAYTSGTTGKPKGVMLSHKNFMYEIEAGLSVFDLKTSDRSLSFLPWAHIFGHVTEVHAVIRSGMSTAIVNDIQEILSDIQLVKPTMLYGVPRIFSKIYTGVMEQIARKPKPIRLLFHCGLKIRQQQLDKQPVAWHDQLLVKLADLLIYRKILAKFGGQLRLAISGASALSPKVIHFLHQIGIPLYEGYGLSETTSAITLNTMQDSIIGSVGKALSGCRIVIDPQNRVSETEGEVICYGDNVMQGYYNQAEKTAEVMTADGGFRTGDIGKLNDDGFLFITGRVKDQFKLENGKFVAPAPIEEQIKLKPLFAHALIYGANRPFVIALLVIDTIVLKSILRKRPMAGNINEILQKPKIKKLIQKQLNKQVEPFKSYEKPRQFILLTEDWSIDNELLTPTLKIKRQNIEEKYQQEIAALYEEHNCVA